MKQRLSICEHECLAAIGKSHQQLVVHRLTHAIPTIHLLMKWRYVSRWKTRLVRSDTLGITANGRDALRKSRARFMALAKL